MLSFITNIAAGIAASRSYKAQKQSYRTQAELARIQGNAQLNAAKDRVLACTAEAEIGKIYRGKVVTIRDFGAFVEILPGMDGLLHISEMADYRVNKVTDICSEGDFVTVKVIDIDNSGKIRLSRKAALTEMVA